MENETWLRLRIPVEPQHWPPIWRTPIMPFDYAKIQNEREDAMRDLLISAEFQALRYEQDVKDRGGAVGPFYGWSGTPTANTPPRDK
jgi:hypothetical protein